MNRLVPAAVVAAAALGVTSIAPAASTAWPITSASRQALMVAASANPDPSTTHDVDIQTAVERARTRSVRVNTVAQASVTCDGCTAQAGALQVVSARDTRDLDVDNAAVVWATCADCTGRAVSIQVVLARSTRTLRAANRALATNAGCADCQTGAAAYQFVIVGGPDGLTKASRAMLEDLRQQLLTLLGASNPPISSRATPGAGPLVAAPLDKQLDSLAATARSNLAADQGGASVTLQGQTDIH